MADILVNWVVDGVFFVSICISMRIGNVPML